MQQQLPSGLSEFRPMVVASKSFNSDYDDSDDLKLSKLLDLVYSQSQPL